MDAVVLLTSGVRVVHPAARVELPHRGVDVLYDPSFSSGNYGIRVDAPADRSAEVRQILSGAGAAEVREGEREVNVA